MSILAGIIGLAGFLFLFVAVIGVIAPSVFKNKKTGEIPKRSHLLTGGLIASVVSFIIAGILAPDTENAVPMPAGASATETATLANAAEEAPATSAPEGRSTKSLGVTPEEFRREFNNIVVKVDAGYKVAKLDIEEGAVNNIFKYSLGSNVALIGTVNKPDGLLKELMVIVAGGETAEDTLRPIVALLSASQALNPQIEKGQNSKAVMDMVKQALANINTGESVERTVGQLQYTASASKLTGLMFAIGPI